MAWDWDKLQQQRKGPKGPSGGESGGPPPDG